MNHSSVEIWKIIPKVYEKKEKNRFLFTDTENFCCALSICQKNKLEFDCQNHTAIKSAPVRTSIKPQIKSNSVCQRLPKNRRKLKLFI